VSESMAWFSRGRWLLLRLILARVSTTWSDRTSQQILSHHHVVSRLFTARHNIPLTHSLTHSLDDEQRSEIIEFFINVS